MATNQLAEELHKRITKKILKRTVYYGSKDNIWGAHLADMQLISKFNNGFSFISLKCKISAIWLVETACIFLVFSIATVQIECEM